MNYNLKKFVEEANYKKNLYTAGPSSLLEAAITSIQPCFGRNDSQYDEAEYHVLNFLKTLSNHKNIVRLQGSATLAIEIALKSFCRGSILIIGTGYYSMRMYNIIKKNPRLWPEEINYVEYSQLKNIQKFNYDWVVTCYTETSNAFKVDINYIKELANSLNAKLLIDSTGSIGLEDKHELGDIICYSSCKGLFGLTGAAFIAYNDCEIYENRDSHYLDLKTHTDHGVTGPYHVILSLYGIIKDYKKYKERVIRWQNHFTEVFKDNLVHEQNNQPILCTLLDKEVIYKMNNPIIYSPRTDSKGSVVCHIGQVHREIGTISNDLIKSHFSL